MDGQNTEISISADRDFGEMKKVDTPSKIRRVGMYASGIRSIILHTPSTPSTRGLRDGQDLYEPLARDGATSSPKTSNRWDNTGRGFQHRHRP